MTASATPASPPRFRRADLYVMLGSWQSWAILRHFATGEGYTTLGDVATAIGLSRFAARQQLMRLVKVGVLTKGTNKIYKLRAGLQPDRSVPVLDFGHCLLRLDHPNPE